MKTVKLSVHEFAVPSPLTGSIDSDSGYGRATEVGIEIHKRVQDKRGRDHDYYEAEVKTTWEFERNGFLIQVEGRMDGFFDHPDMPVIEEIKSTFALSDLVERLNSGSVHHPYRLQLLTYGYFHYKKHGVIPELTFHLVSSRNYESKDMSVKLKLEEYEEWLEKRLAEIEKAAIAAEKRTKRRRKIAEKFQFPFESPRTGQVELIQTIEENLESKTPMLLQAPTGLGKTVGVLYPSLRDALKRGRSVIYATPKNSQHTVAEDAVERFQEKGSAVKSLTLTAKSKLCMKAEPLCNPRYCEFAKDYYDKLAKYDLADVLAKKKKLNSKVFKKLAEEFEVCPFELQLEAVKEADTVICDYNYVFSAHSALKRAGGFNLDDEGLDNLVIDEAHNLPSRAMAYYSPALSTDHIRRIREDFVRLPKRTAFEAGELAQACISLVQSLRPKNSTGSVPIKVDAQAFLELDGKLRDFLSQYLNSDIEIEPKDPILRLCFYWGEFTGILEDIQGLDLPQFFTLFLDSETVKITCCDASEMLKDTYKEFENVIAFSATLKPFEYYSKLMGLPEEKLKREEFQSPFDPKHRKVLIIPQISTKFSERAKNYPRIVEAISRISAVKPGNYLVFFPSFDFMDKVAQQFPVPHGTDLMLQARNSHPNQVEETLERLKKQERPTFLFAVQGGVYSEGVDYPGDMVIGVFVVGPPLPIFDLERETMKKYYEETYKAGFDYAYTYPAMAKAVQSAGRAIRSETDRGVIVLLDSRFLEKNYSKSMPDGWFQESSMELVSNRIVADVREFWELVGEPESAGS